MTTVSRSPPPPPPQSAPTAPGIVHCEHGQEAEELVAAPQLTALPTLEPLALDVGGPPMLTTKAPPPPQQQPHQPLTLPRSPRPADTAPQDDVAGTAEDVEDVAAIMDMTGGGGGLAGAIEKTKKQQHPMPTPTPEKHPPTPAARPPSAAPPRASPRASSPVALVGPPLLLPEEQEEGPHHEELPATPPSSPVQEEEEDKPGGVGVSRKLSQTHPLRPHHPAHHPAPPPAAAAATTTATATPSPSASAPPPPAWQQASLRRVAAAREGIFAGGGEREERSPGWLSRWPVTAPQVLLLARDALATGVHESPLLDRRPGAFSFSAPFVGPIRGADAFARTMRELGIDDAFDVSPRAYGFLLDPLEAGRVWFFTRPVSVFSRPLKAGGPLLPAVPPTGEVVRSPPQVASLKFEVVEGGEGGGGGSVEGGGGGSVEGGGGGSWADDPLLPPGVRCTEMTYGYVCDRRQGDTGGLGGAFGILHAAGRAFPFPEGRPWRSSWQQTLFNRGGSVGRAAAWAVDRALQAACPWGAPVAAARNAP